MKEYQTRRRSIKQNNLADARDVEKLVARVEELEELTQVLIENCRQLALHVDGVYADDMFVIDETED